ncbi:MAG: hypothetical protein ACLP3C_15625 [Mycobacterium sp.]|uniref:hypothetical protein n=1 Tax=Mycobacterium sp. TaxID=1785 RepID=UPI003F9802CE
MTENRWSDASNHPIPGARLCATLLTIVAVIAIAGCTPPHSDRECPYWRGIQECNHHD